MRHAFGDRKLAMLYLPKELKFRYWKSYRYGDCAYCAKEAS
jgi:hypothetical protein